MRVSIIAAMAKNRVIGREGKLPWKLPADLKHFKNLTLGHHIIMGRKTYESIGRPLAGRTSIVVTHQPDYKAEGCLVATSLRSAISLALSDGEPFIIGGASIYRQALSLADRIYLTVIHQDFQGDVHFPEFSEDAWWLKSREDHDPDSKNPYPYSFLIHEKYHKK